MQYDLDVIMNSCGEMCRIFIDCFVERGLKYLKLVYTVWWIVILCLLSPCFDDSMHGRYASLRKKGTIVILKSNSTCPVRIWGTLS